MSMITELVERLKDLYVDTELDMLCGVDGECRQAIKESAQVIEELSAKLQVANMERSSQYYNGGWIPCSERLPEAFEFVNCTCHSLIDDREDWVIETVYIPQPSDSPYSDWGNIPMLNSGDCKVVAWMHRDIPEPYRTESEE